MSDLASSYRGGSFSEPSTAELKAQLASARSTISEQEKRIAELEARIAAFEKHHEEQAQLISGLAHDAERNFDALTSERQRREELEAIARPLAQGWHSYGNTEEGKLELLRGTLGIWHFKEAAEHFRKYEPGK